MQRGRVRNRDQRAGAVELQRACRTCPVAAQVAFAIVPLFPFPDASVTVVPDPSSNPYAATSPDGLALAASARLVPPRFLVRATT